MKKMNFILLALFFSAFMALPAWADGHGHNRNHEYSNQSGVGQRNLHPNTARGRYDIHGNYYKDKRNHRDYEYRHPKERPHGYRPEPYDRRYPHPRVWKNHPYHYEGHWNSWADWDRYAQRHPDRYRHGKYIREGGHLLFRFYDPTAGGYLFFSIGK